MKKYEKKWAVKDIAKRKLEMSVEQKRYLESIKREKVKVNSISADSHGFYYSVGSMCADRRDK